VIFALSISRRWLLDIINHLDDLTTRVKNIIGRELVHHSRWTANATRTHHPTAPPTFDSTPMPVDITSGFHAIRLDIPTSCIAVGLL
jgi:hypothetical protein